MLYLRLLLIYIRTTCLFVCLCATHVMAAETFYCRCSAFLWLRHATAISPFSLPATVQSPVAPAGGNAIRILSEDRRCHLMESLRNLFCAPYSYRELIFCECIYMSVLFATVLVLVLVLVLVVTWCIEKLYNSSKASYNQAPKLH
jgi:hypothetical protein